MTEIEIASLASKIALDSNYWIALIGALGVIVGALLTILGNLVIVWFKNKTQNKRDKIRQAILKQMLNHKDYSWRNLSILSAVIGCSEEETKNHLILIDARGSEKNDGKWGLIARNPMENIKNLD